MRRPAKNRRAPTQTYQAVAETPEFIFLFFSFPRAHTTGSPKLTPMAARVHAQPSGGRRLRFRRLLAALASRP